MNIGPSDFIALGTFAWIVYRSCKDAPESFQSISHDVLSLHALLRETEETVALQPLPLASQARLRIILDGCSAALTDLQALVNRYESLGTQSKWTWDRMRWSADEAAELRSRLTSSAVLLGAFITTSQVTVQKKLDRYVQEYREGKREGSIVSTQTVESISTDDKEAWRLIRKELESIGITAAAFNENKSFIVNWFAEAVAKGTFEEQPDDQFSDDQTSDAGSFDELSEKPDTIASSEDASSPTSPYDQDRGGFFASKPVKRKPPPSPKPPAASANKYDKLSESLTKTISRSKESINSPKAAALVAKMSRPGTALLAAVKSGHLPKARAILENQVKMSVISKKTLMDAVAEAVPYGQIEMVKLILDASDDIPLESALKRAIHWDQVEVVALLLERGGDIKDRNLGAGDTPLTLAAARGLTNIVSLLLSKKANTEVRDGELRTPLLLAALYGHTIIAQMLLGEGADIEARDKQQQTALFVAATRGYKELVQLLLDNGANTEARDIRSDTTLLLMAARDSNAAFIELLLSKRANINARDAKGYTPLLLATIISNTENVWTLLRRGADVNAKTEAGETALQLALRGPSSNISESISTLLRQFGATN